MEWIDPAVSDWDKFVDEFMTLAQSMDHVNNKIADIEIIVEKLKSYEELL